LHEFAKVRRKKDREKKEYFNSHFPNLEIPNVPILGRGLKPINYVTKILAKTKMTVFPDSHSDIIE
jgi:hypothetical protein